MRNVPKLHVPYYEAGSDSFVDYVMDYTATDNPSTSPSFDVSGLSLKEITFRGGELVFTGAHELSRIDLKNDVGTTVKTFRFYQSYKTAAHMDKARVYNGSNFQGTLYLDSLTSGSSSQTYETYKFQYHNKYCYGNHLVGHDAWKYPNLSTREIGGWEESTVLPSVTTPETYYFSVTNYNDKIDSVLLTTPGSPWSLSSDEESMRSGVLKRIVYPTGGFVDFDFEANRYPVSLLVRNFSVYDPDYTSVYPQLCGGLRIRSINYYEAGDHRPVMQKYYRYGRNENGMGDLVYAPKIDGGDDTYHLSAVTASRFVAHVEWPCDGYVILCNDRSKLTLLSIERKKMLYPASELDYSYGNGVFVYYTDVSEYNMEMGAQSGKTAYSYFSPKDFYVPPDDGVLRNILSQLRSAVSGNAQVTGYTYKRLTGMSGSSDAGGKFTFYEYDPYGRLTCVKDNAGKTLQTYNYRIPHPSHFPYLWCVNTPQFLSVTRDCPSGGKQSYGVILPGGGAYMAATTELANRSAREDYQAGLIAGIGFPPDCNIPYAKVELSGIYTTWEHPFFSNGAWVDFLQNGSIVYSVEVPFGDMNNFENPYFPTVELYIVPGTYEVSVRMSPETHYNNGNIPQYSCNVRDNYESIVRFNATDATLTFAPSVTYDFHISCVYARSATPMEEL